MGFRDWFRRRPAEVPTWDVRTDGSEVVINASRYPLVGVRCVRVVPLTGGNPHGGSGRGWQVTLHRDDGDVLIDKAQQDWRPARELAQRLCDATELPLDELTQRLFSQVGQYSPKE